MQHFTKCTLLLLFLPLGLLALPSLGKSVAITAEENYCAPFNGDIPFGKALFEHTLRNCDGTYIVYFYSYNNVGVHTWDFGDGSYGEGFNTEHAYDLPGNYEVTHTVEYKGNTFTKTYFVDIKDPNSYINIGEDTTITYFHELISDSILPPLKAIDMYLSIKGTLVLTTETQKYVFSKCNIRMEPGAKIVAESGTRLSFGGSSFLYSCEQMWQGVEAMPGSTVRVMERSFIEDAQYALYIHGGANLLISCFFNRNYISLYIPPTPDESYHNVSLEAPLWGLRFFCTRPLNQPYDGQTYPYDLPVQGEVSYAGIHFSDLNYVEVGGNVAGIFNYFSDLANGVILHNIKVALVQTNLMKNILATDNYPDASGRGVWARGSGINVLNVTGNGVVETPAFPLTLGVDDVSSFTNCTTGILADGVAATVSNNIMMEVETGIDIRNAVVEEIHVDNNQISAIKNGVLVRFCSGNSDFLIENNYVEVGEDGLGMEGIMIDNIFATSFAPAIIKNNEVHMHYCPPGGRINGISANLAINLGITDNVVHRYEPQGPTSDDIYCISVAESNKVKVSCNEVIGINLVGYLSKGIGFYSTSEAEVRCNFLDRTGFGFEFKGMNYLFDFAGNYIYRHFFGLYLAEDTQLTPVGQDVHEYRGNEWWNNPYNANDPELAGALNEGNFFNVNVSRFSVYPDYNFTSFSIFDPEPWITPQTPIYYVKWFTATDVQPTTTADGCNYNCDAGLNLQAPPSTGLIDNYIAEDKPLWKSEYQGARFEAERTLYQKLAENPELVEAGSSIETFYKKTEQSHIPAFAKVDEAVLETSKLSLGAQAIIQSNLKSFDDVLTELQNIDYQLAHPEKFNASEAEMQEKRIKVQHKLVALANERNEAVKNIQRSLTSSFQRAATINKSIEAQGIHEEFEQTVTDIYLKTAAKGNFNFTSDQVADLQVIAFECPYVGGKAVYKARAMYRLIDPAVSFSDNAACRESTEVGQQVTHTTEIKGYNNFHLFPNPASEQVSITIPAERVDQVIFYTLFDQTGKQVKGGLLKEQENVANINLGNIAEGFYSLVFKSTDATVIGVEKLSIVR